MNQNPKLIIQQGPFPGTELEISGAKIVIGREAPANVLIPGAGVSRAHAQLTLQGDSYVLEDSGSTNDIVLNSPIVSCQHATLERTDDGGYRFIAIATRGGSGRVIFTTMANGEIANAKDIFAFGLDPEFEWQNDTTNRMTIVARGSTMTIFTNGTQIAQFDVKDPPPPPYIPPPPPNPADLNDPVQVAAYNFKN